MYNETDSHPAALQLLLPVQVGAGVVNQDQQTPNMCVCVCVALQLHVHLELTSVVSY